MTNHIPALVLTESDARRFYAKVDPPDTAGCRLWTKSVDANGYGQFHLTTATGWRTVKAHLVAWTLERGGFPPDLEPDHTCNVRRCQTVEHFEWVTHEENCRRIAERATHCRSSEHAWADPGVTIIRADGSRECRPCRLARRRRNYALTGRT